MTHDPRKAARRKAKPTPRTFVLFLGHFESGFPHGTNQFISAFATGWATLALLTSFEEQK